MLIGSKEWHEAVANRKPMEPKVESTKSRIDLWANFLANERLTPARVGERVMELVALCEKMAETRGPVIRPHGAKLASRTFVCRTAMDLGLDLPGLKHRGKICMGRGLLDAWNAEYVKRFGSTVGTASAREATRRDVKTKLCDAGIKGVRLIGESENAKTAVSQSDGDCTVEQRP